MKFETAQYFYQAIAEHGLQQADLDALFAPSDDLRQVRFEVPEEHRRLVYFSKTLLSLAKPSAGLLIMPVGWGIWPSSDNWHLYRFVRAAHGNADTLGDRPCHCFETIEHEVALDFLQLFLGFSWGFYIFAYRQSELLFVSHDGYAMVWSQERSGEILQSLVDEGLTDRGQNI